VAVEVCFENFKERLVQVVSVNGLEQEITECL
jgi:hypothetical protein